jgi:hypothetical protein
MQIIQNLSHAAEELREARFERRRLLQSLAVGGIAALGGGILAGCGGSGTELGSGVADADVLNFALNLEYLEAEYYLRAMTGQGLSAADSGAGRGAVTGGRRVNFSTPAFEQYGAEIAADELAHVRFLRRALGPAAVPRPAIDIGPSFAAAAAAAGLGNGFDPYDNEVNFLIGAFVFEDVGVTAYKGAAGLIANKATLEAAAGILGVEAYHAGTVRTVIFSLGGAAVNAAQRISDLRDSAAGTEKDQGVSVGGRANIVPTDANGIAFSRSTTEVLKIVYLGGTDKGGFFPDGLNGAIA